MAIDTLQNKGRSTSQEKRQQIFDAAASLFADKGYEGTSMDQVAEAAGVSKQTIYSHFGDKEGLFVASIKHKCTANSLDVTFFRNNLPVQEMLLKLAHHFVKLLLNEETIGVHRVCIAGAEQYPEVSRLYYQAGPESLITLLTEYLQTQVDKGILHIDNPQYAAWQFLFMLKGNAPFKALLGLETGQNQAQRDQYHRSCVDMFLRAYKA